MASTNKQEQPDDSAGKKKKVKGQPKLEDQVCLRKFSRENEKGRENIWVALSKIEINIYLNQIDITRCDTQAVPENKLEYLNEVLSSS